MRQSSRILFYLGIFSCLLCFACKTNKFKEYPATKQNISYMGRAVYNEHGLVLISSSSSAEIYYKGDSCKIGIRNLAPGDDYSYIIYELDGLLYPKMKISGHEEQWLNIRTEREIEPHQLKIFKLTEAQTGNVAITRMIGEDIRSMADTFRRIKIEFIGNSITCGMGQDTTIPCGQGKWYDQHDGYNSYAARTGRALRLQYMLSAVSGIGIYRNWNSDGPTIPEVYESTYLNKDSLLRWDFNEFIPDMVGISLGTNDLSDGDGKTPRAPFDSSKFEQSYSNFINTIYSHYPETQIILINSPMISGTKGDYLYRCLARLAEQSNKNNTGKKQVLVFHFDPLTPTGCDYHPGFDDHFRMAFQLEAFISPIATKLKKPEEAVIPTIKVN